MSKFGLYSGDDLRQLADRSFQMAMWIFTGQTLTVPDAASFAEAQENDAALAVLIPIRNKKADALTTGIRGDPSAVAEIMTEVTEAQRYCADLTEAVVRQSLEDQA